MYYPCIHYHYKGYYLGYLYPYLCTTYTTPGIHTRDYYTIYVY